MSTDCNSFIAHSLRPEKCRNCFTDRSRHKKTVNSAVTEMSTTSPTSESCDNMEEWTKERLISSLRECREESLKLKLDVEDKVGKYEQEIAKLKLELAEKDSGEDVTDIKATCCCKKCEIKLEELTKELELCKTRCKSLEKERDSARDEVRALEHEMEEMHDSFKEEESEQFEQLKQELDLSLKNCKILQIRLNKAERQYNQLEQVKTLIEAQLEEANGLRQQELTTTSTVNNISFAQIGTDFVKLSANEYDQLVRDLNDTIEREKDLQEQIKYSQEEAQLKGDRLSAIETENEVLLSKVNKLTLANPRLRLNPLRCSSGSDSNNNNNNNNSDDTNSSDNGRKEELIQQNEQLKLALEVAQSECERIKNKWLEVRSLSESRESLMKELEKKKTRLEEELTKLKMLHRATTDSSSSRSAVSEQIQSLSNRFELECRQLRTKLVHSERECKQLKAQLELSSNGRQSRAGGDNVRAKSNGNVESAQTTSGEQAKFKEINRQLKEQCDSLVAQNEELERKVEQLSANQNVGKTLMESDLLEKLKKQLDTSESELAKARSRLVEMDVECGRVQRQYKRLVESLEKCENETLVGKRLKLPVESMRDSMSRLELRQALKELEEEVDECLAVIKSKDCLVQELSRRIEELSKDRPASPTSQSEEQVKSLRRMIDQERLMSSNLKVDVDRLEKELETCTRMSEREREAMEEELDKLRQVNSEINLDLHSAREGQREVGIKLKEMLASNEKLRLEIDALKQKQQQVESKQIQSVDNNSTSQQSSTSGQKNQDLLLLNRDLSELKVKNGFLMRQLEIAREENARQLDDLRLACETQQRRVVELAQLELKEKQLSETQQLREELNDTKQRLANTQRQVARSEEDASGERERLRSFERDWRRDKSQWQQRVEQLEAQMTIERRSNEFKVKEAEAVVKEKERELMGMQGKYVQMERDLKRLQNKYNLLEENSESKMKNLHRDLEAKKRELSEVLAKFQTREDEYYENCKRFNKEKATVLEALESIKRSYDDKLNEVKSLRQLLSVRQDQSYKERLNAQEKIETLNSQLLKMADNEVQLRLVKHRLELQEKQLDTLKRESLHLKEDRTRLKTRCDDLEKRCAQYEKQELISKTSTITTNSFLKSKFLGSSSSAKEQNNSKDKQLSVLNGQQGLNDECSNNEKDPSAGMVERLTGKISDQRHLINMIKQQYDEAQLELKQMKLVQSGERNKWQSRVAQLTSRLNECEEKLLFEQSSMLNQETVDNSRRKLESSWTEERNSILSNVQQLQTQNEILIRDMKKLSQSYDLLRLQSKQLESYNNKLSKKLIEYQQQQTQSESVGFSSSTRYRNELDACITDRKELMARQGELIEVNARLVSIMNEQAKPIVETVKRILNTVDGTGGSTALKMSVSPSDSESRSTSRPLMTQVKQKHSDDTSDTSSIFAADSTISSAKPAHQTVATQSRLSRLLGKQSTNIGKSLQSDISVSNSSTAKDPVKVVKRVKVKASSLGITLLEKKKLRSNLQELSLVLDEINTLDKYNISRQQERGSPLKSVIDPHRDIQVKDPKTKIDNQQPKGPVVPYSSSSQLHSRSETDSPHSRVHWQDDGSDLDSEKSWALESANKRGQSNNYRRFPQALPTNRTGGASLTDYESESSLTSDFSSLSIQNRSNAGAESDSCMQTSLGQVKLKSSGRKRGLKGRLTSTLRHISRSITGLASDSDNDSVTDSGKVSKFRHKSSKKEVDNQILQEIRV